MKFFEAAFSGGVGSSLPSKNWIPEWFMRGGGGSRSSTGLIVSPERAMNNSAAFACQRAISESLAMLPRDMFQSLENEGRQRISKHKSLKCLKSEANPIQTSYQFFKLLQNHALSAGNGYAELQFVGKDIVAMWPLPPQQVKPIVIESNNEPDLVYEITTDANREPIILPKDRILHIPGIGFDGIRGYPLVDFMINAIALGLSLEEFSSLFFKQGAGLQGYVSVPDTFDETQINNVRAHMAIINEGLDNAHRMKFLYESAKFNPAGATPEQAEMTASKIFQIQEVARFYRMPLHKIQETSKPPNYSSMEQFNIEFVNDTLTPWVTNWEQEINRKFFDFEDNFYVKFNINALLRGDAKSRALFYRTMVFTGIMTPNEARALEDLPPLPGGNKRMVPLNMAIEGEDSEGGSDSDKSMDGNERIQD